jgi:hypothetical protein
MNREAGAARVVVRVGSDAVDGACADWALGTVINGGVVSAWVSPYALTLPPEPSCELGRLR